jgi:hypothetical protein
VALKPLALRYSIGTLVFAGLLVAGSVEAGAQPTGDGFLFSEPKGTITVRGGFNQPRGSSDLFAFFFDNLTLGRRDFTSALIAGDVAVHVNRRTAVVANFAFTRANAASEFRHFAEGDDDLPIRQTTEFVRMPITVGVKTYLTPEGRPVGRLAWVPARYAVFLGAAAGPMRYVVKQQGDFVDFNTLRIFPDNFVSTGVRGAIHAFGGVDLNVSPRMAVTVETRYEWAHAKLDRDFGGFEPIDLSGLTFTTGLTFRVTGGRW